METIAMGIDAATKVLGVGADVYSKILGPGANLQKAQANQANAEANYYQQKPQIEKSAQINEALKGITSQGLELASADDRDPTKRPYLVPGLGTSVWVKNGTKLQQDLLKEHATMSDEAAKLFGGLDEVQRFKTLHEAAAESSALAKAPPSKANHLALLTQFIRAQSPNARFNGDNVEGVEAGISSALDQAVQKFKQLYSSEGGTLSPKEVNSIIGSIATQYNSVRPIYENRWKEYQKIAKERGIDVRGYEKPVEFPGVTQHNVNDDAINKFLKK
jgi:hypothetical protein